MSYQSEAALEKEVMDRLIDLGYEHVSILNDKGLTVSRQKIGRIMKKHNLVSVYTKVKYIKLSKRNERKTH